MEADLDECFDSEVSQFLKKCGESLFGSVANIPKAATRTYLRVLAPIEN
jgi:hypothetical protein